MLTGVQKGELYDMELNAEKTSKALVYKENPEVSRTSGFRWFGGEGGIRTLERLLTVTRFPIVRARPGYATSP